MPEGGLVSFQSRSAASETIDRLLSALAKRKLAVFARVDHTAGAASVGLQLRPTELVIFGNPQGGTALMQDQQSAGIDLPLKALVWEDSDGRRGSPITIQTGSRSATLSAQSARQP